MAHVIAESTAELDLGGGHDITVQIRDSIRSTEREIVSVEDVRLSGRDVHDPRYRLATAPTLRFVRRFPRALAL